MAAITGDGDYGGGWINAVGAVTSVAAGAPGISTYTYQWPPAAVTQQPPMPLGWKCADCGTVMAPWMPSHKCPVTTTATETATGNAATQVLYKTGSEGDAP